jgi:acetyltransferase-like isoleucine patch superfamily enzyme
MGNIIGRVRARVISEISRLYQPQMVGVKRGPGRKVLRNTRISNTAVIVSPGGLVLEDNVFVFHYSILDASHGLTIKEGCQIGGWVGIFTHSSHISIRLYGEKYSDHHQLKGYITGPVTVGKYSFIGPHSILMPNTSIGKGSIVAAHSYVRGEFPDFAIIGGNPAKVIGDTRKTDQAFLRKYPELEPLYSQWAEGNDDA